MTPVSSTMRAVIHEPVFHGQPRSVLFGGFSLPMHYEIATISKRMISRAIGTTSRNFRSLKIISITITQRFVIL
ncbi:hypothetical protein I3843_01G089500 [Carya illinoinensis]|nr:hypothetical protein I3843_01G089500 [Carya illinoinensis]